MTPPPTGRQPPARLVPAPRARKGTSSSLQTLTMLDDLLGGGREDDDVGLVLLDGEAVALVDEQLSRGGDHSGGADDGSQLIEQHETGPAGVKGTSLLYRVARKTHRPRDLAPEGQTAGPEWERIYASH